MSDNSKSPYKAFIAEIILRNFKKHENLKLAIDRDIVIITGNNAKGKTSILDAIYFCSFAKSHLDLEDDKLITFGKEYGKVTIRENGDIYEALLAKEGKSVFINHVPYRKLSEFVNRLPSVMFYPDDIGIINGTPQDRRKFFDREICRFSHDCMDTLNVYRKLLKNRNDELKNAFYDKNLSFLSILSSELIKEAKTIIRLRRDFVKKLNEELKEVSKFFFDGEAYEIIYHESAKLETIEGIFQEKMEADIAAKTTSFGPHRDQFICHVNGKTAFEYASVGQKKSFVIGLKLAIIRLLIKHKNIIPILLLDDLFSELDSKRQNRILENFKNMQIFITTTDLKGLNENLVKAAQVIRLE